MVVTLEKTLKQLLRYMDNQQRLRTAEIGEPRSPPETFHGAVWPQSYRNPSTTLDGSIERRIILARFYINGMREPISQTEFDLDEAMAQLHSDILKDFTLGGTGVGDIRNIEVTEMEGENGWQTVGTVMFRIGTWTIPVTIDDNAKMAK